MEDWPTYESNCSSVESSLLAKDATTYIDIKCLSMVKSIQDRFNFRNVPPSNNYYYEDVGSDHEEPVTSTAIHSPSHLKRVCFGFITTVLIVIGALVVFLLLLLAGDVEINPGPGLDTVLTVSDLFEVCERVKSASLNWFNLGLALELSYTDLIHFRDSHRGDSDVCLREVLALRLQTGAPLTWGGICAALRGSTVEKNDVAEEIEEYMYAQSTEKEALKITQSTQKSDSSDDSVLTLSDILEVYEQVRSASPNWFNLGLVLELSYTTIIHFRDLYRGDSDVCLLEVLARRLQTGVPLTWGGICTALRHSTVKRNDVAEEIKEYMYAQSREKEALKITQSTEKSDSSDDSVLTLSDLLEVYEKVRRASPNWFNLGLALKLSYTDLTNFRKTYHDHSDVCLREVLARRLQTGIPLTWGGICTALRHSTVKKHDVAEEIEEYMYAQSREKEALKITQSTQKSDSSDDSVLTLSDILEVYEQVRSASPNWFNLGLVLKLSYTDLTMFRDSYHGDSDVCLREALARRLQSGAPLTWGGMCTALRHSTVSRSDVAEEIEEHFHALPGVEVMASTCVIITNSPQTFHWVGYGLRLTIPQGSLPPGVDQCQLDIKVSVAGHYQFPNNFQLVSGVFWVRPHPSGRFQQQLTVEIQHCAKMSSSTKLSFMRAHCSQKSLPYTFKQLEERGSFTEYSLYGCLGVNHFSSLAIAAKDDADLQYIASLHYLKADPRTVEIYFTINMDDGTHNAETRKYFENLGAKEKLNMAVEFDDCNIALDIPLPNGVEVDEWSLVPLVLPKIFKKRVDSFEPGRAVPSTKLVATLSESWDCKVPRRSHLTTLKGAKEPINQMLIMFDPVDLKKDPLASDQHKRLSTSDEQIETLSKRLKNDITVQAVHGSQHGAPVAATASFLQGDQSGAQPEDPIALSHRKRALASDKEVETPSKRWKEDIALSSEEHPNKRPSSDPIVLTGKDVQTICVTLVNACNNWLDLGLALGMDYDQLESIQDQFRDNSGRLKKMIAKRLSVTDPKNPMTWPYICECLRNPTVMRYDVAEAIEREKGL